MHAHCSLVFLHLQWDKVQVPNDSMETLYAQPLPSFPATRTSIFIKTGCSTTWISHCFLKVACSLMPTLPQMHSVDSLIKIIWINLSSGKRPKGHLSDQCWPCCLIMVFLHDSLLLHSRISWPSGTEIWEQCLAQGKHLISVQWRRPWEAWGKELSFSISLFPPTGV